VWSSTSGAPSGGGEVWEDNESVFTLDHSDFDDLTFGLTYVFGLNNNLEIGFNADFYDATSRSEYRDFVDSVGFSILHDTRLELVPLTVDVRFLPGGRYAYRGSVGQHRLLKPVPYLGLGMGLQIWEYEEVGDFLDFSVDPPEIFPGRFVDSGVTLEVHGLAGIELPVAHSATLLFEVRYSWAEEELSGDFSGLGTLDLSGASLYGGFSVRF